MRGAIVHEGITGRFGPTPPSLAERIVRTVRVWRGRVAARARLAELDDRLLADIGVTPADAAHEARKPFWQS